MAKKGFFSNLFSRGGDKKEVALSDIADRQSQLDQEMDQLEKEIQASMAKTGGVPAQQDPYPTPTPQPAKESRPPAQTQTRPQTAAPSPATRPDVGNQIPEKGPVPVSNEQNLPPRRDKKDVLDDLFSSIGSEKASAPVEPAAPKDDTETATPVTRTETQTAGISPLGVEERTKVPSNELDEIYSDTRTKGVQTDVIAADTRAQTLAGDGTSPGPSPPENKQVTPGRTENIAQRPRVTGYSGISQDIGKEGQDKGSVTKGPVLPNQFEEKKDSSRTDIPKMAEPLGQEVKTPISEVNAEPKPESDSSLIDELFAPIGENPPSDPISENTTPMEPPRSPQMANISKIECYNCGNLIPTDISKKPFILKCSRCGAEGLIE
jgi:hypothetical protein